MSVNCLVESAIAPMAKWVEVNSEGQEEILIENFQSAVWYVPYTHKDRLTSRIFHVKARGENK